MKATGIRIRYTQEKTPRAKLGGTKVLGRENGGRFTANDPVMSIMKRKEVMIRQSYGV